MKDNEFRMMIADYGNSLGDIEKKIARKVFRELIQKGKSLEWICIVIEDFKANGKSIAKYKNMLFSYEYQEEIDLKLELKHRDEAELERRSKELAAAITRQMVERAKMKPIIIKRKKKEKTKASYSLEDIEDMEDNE